MINLFAYIKKNHYFCSRKTGLEPELLCHAAISYSEIGCKGTTKK